MSQKISTKKSICYEASSPKREDFRFVMGHRLCRAFHHKVNLTFGVPEHVVERGEKTQPLNHLNRPVL
jgi:hypothetical protein